MRTIAVGLCLIGLWGGTREAVAQQAEVGVLGGQVTDERGTAHGALTLSPSLSWSDQESVVRLSGQATAFQGGWYASTGLGVGATVARLGPLGLVVGGEGQVAASGAGYRAARGAVQPRLSLSTRAWGVEAGPVWAGGGERMGAGGGPTGWIPIGGREDDPELRWRGERGLSVAAWTARGPISARGEWRTREIAGARWQEWSGGAALELGAATLAVRAGLRTAPQAGEEEQWVAGSARIALSERIALLAEAGGYPSDPLSDRAAGRFASVGLALQLGETRSGYRPTPPPPMEDGGIRLSLRAEPGARVELLGDWTNWQPVPVPETRPGRYSVLVELPPGVHRFAFRVDGQWRIPDGFETEPDGFGGEHAVLRVR